MRPSSFGLLAHIDPMANGGQKGAPTALYTPNLDEWEQIGWYDRVTGQPILVTIKTPHDPGFFDDLQAGAVRIKTLSDVVNEFKRRPEHRSLAPNGEPTEADTQGLLRRRPIESAAVLTDLIGKEGNDLDERERGLFADSDEYRNQYGNRGNRWRELVLPILNDPGVHEVMRRAGRSQSAAYGVIGGRTHGTGSPMRRYKDVAINHAIEALGIPMRANRRHPDGILYLYACSR